MAGCLKCSSRMMCSGCRWKNPHCLRRAPLWSVGVDYSFSFNNSDSLLSALQGVFLSLGRHILLTRESPNLLFIFFTKKKRLIHDHIYLDTSFFLTENPAEIKICVYSFVDVFIPMVEFKKRYIKLIFHAFQKLRKRSLWAPHVITHPCSLFLKEQFGACSWLWQPEPVYFPFNKYLKLKLIFKCLVAMSTNSTYSTCWFHILISYFETGQKIQVFPMTPIHL